jgi:hypothetical protein
MKARLKEYFLAGTSLVWLIGRRKRTVVVHTGPDVSRTRQRRTPLTAATCCRSCGCRCVGSSSGWGRRSRHLPVEHVGRSPEPSRREPGPTPASRPCPTGCLEP